MSKGTRAMIRRTQFAIVLRWLMLLTAGFCCLPFIANAQDQLSVILRFPAVQILPGEPLELRAYFYNESPAVFTGSLPETLAMRLQSADAAATLVTAVETEAGPPVNMAPGQFSSKTYRLVVPTVFAGTVEVVPLGHPESAVLLNAAEPERVAAKAKKAAETPSAAPGKEHYPSLESLFSLYQPYVVNFSAYEPMYFLVGMNPEDSKFQISFKYRLFNPAGSLSQAFPWLRGLHFAYTQTSFWDLSSDSAPFEDTSYKPELFLLSSNWKNRPKWLRGLFFQTGIQHESNGRGEQFSRSTNTVYIKPILVFYDEKSALGLQVSPKLLTYINNNDTTNSDLADYRGFSELEIKFGKANGLVSTTQLRFAERGTSLQTDLTYPISKILKNNFDMFFQVQYSNSLAESLINYRQRSETLRLGLSFVR
ncbi:phospholipase A [Malonomonas rubra]|nr:phospholipase A [Malonomonas rubra]